MPSPRLCQRIIFRAESIGRIKDLRGFQKSHTIPDRNSALAEKFLARVAAEDVRADMDETFQKVRESFGFKRRQIESSTDEASGVIRTPHFQYMINAQVLPSDAGKVLWRREITGLRDPLAIRGQEFQAVYGSLFHLLELPFTKAYSIEKLIDRLEVKSPELKLTYPSDAAHCEIVVPGYRGNIRIEPERMVIEGRSSDTTASLFDAFLTIFDHLPRGRGWPALR